MTATAYPLQQPYQQPYQQPVQPFQPQGVYYPSIGRAIDTERKAAKRLTWLFVLLFTAVAIATFLATRPYGGPRVLTNETYTVTSSAPAADAAPVTAPTTVAPTPTTVATPKTTPKAPPTTAKAQPNSQTNTKTTPKK